MNNYGVLMDSVFGDIDFSISNKKIDIISFESNKEYLENMIRGRLKSDINEMLSFSRYNLFNYLGKNNINNENIISSSILNILSFDNLINKNNLKVVSISEKDKTLIGIKIINSTIHSNQNIEILITRNENGKLY